jgi:pre-mRNA-splicing factor SYF1
MYIIPLFFSYKLWYNYLKLRRRQVKGRCVTDPSYEDVNNAFERSLVFMHKVINSFLFT